MKKKSAYIIIFLIISVYSKLSGQNNKLLDAYFESMFSGQYKNTVKVLVSLKKDNYNDVKTRLASANFYIVMYQTSGNLEKFNILCKKEADYVNKILTEKKDLTYDEVYLIISAKSIILKIQIIKKNYLKVAKEFRKILKYFEYATEHEDNIKMKLISGMYNYYIETAKEDYPIAYPVLIFFPSGNKQKGLRLLKECTKSDEKSISIRSQLFLANMYRRDEKSFEKSNYWFKQLLQKYPANVFWLSEYIFMLREFNKLKEADFQKEKLLKIISESNQLTEEQILHLKNL
ncbi:MAG: hypothetical protein L3J35_02940 [Bacteroidales bacterium]|nr:hypothetical protein [Bacteroidales bacterium]